MYLFTELWAAAWVARILHKLNTIAAVVMQKWPRGSGSGPIIDATHPNDMMQIKTPPDPDSASATAHDLTPKTPRPAVKSIAQSRAAAD